MQRSIRVSALGAVVAASAATAIVAYQPQGSDVVLAQGDDRLPSRTASQWVTYADYVVEVTPVSQKEIPPMKEDLQHGEGVILRDVKLRVERVLWSRPGAPKAAPEVFDWTAFGWKFSDGDMNHRTKMAVADAPRIEEGHHYILAIDWQAARCAPGDYVPAQWDGLGEGSILPFDDKTIGEGEMEGQHQSVTQARADTDSSDPNYGLEDRMVGKSADTLVKILKNAQPHARKNFALTSAKKTSCG